MKPPKSPQQLTQLGRDTLLAKRIREVYELHQNLLTETGTIRALALEQKQQLSRILNLPKGDKGEKGDIGPRGLTGKDGRDGRDGRDGIDGVTPIKGQDYLTEKEVNQVILSVMSRIRQPKDGEDAVIDEEKIVETVIATIKEKQLLGTDHIKGLRTEMSSYRSQMALRQAGQHGGGDTVVAGTGITITNNSNGTKTIAATGGGVGTVTDVSVVSANGFAGSVATSTTTPAITLSTTITGLLKGNGTAISAAVANTDYQVPITLTTTGTSGAATFNGTTLNIPQYSSGTGDVVGPASATDTAIATYNGTTGKLIKNNSGVLIDSNGRIRIGGADGSAMIDIIGATPAVQGLRIQGDQASALSFSTFVAADSFLRFTFLASGQMTWGDGTVAGDTNLYRSAANTLKTDDALIVTGALTPASNDGSALGSATVSWADLFLASGGVINWNNGDVLVTHSANTLAFTGASSGYTFDASVSATNFIPTSSTVPTNGMYLPAANTLGWAINSAAEMQLTSTALSPAADGGSSLGTTTLGWQNLFGNTGFVINIENANWLATHTSGILTVGTGDLRVTTAGADVTSVTTNSGTQTLTNKRIQPRSSTTTSGDITPDLATANVWQRTAQSATLTINSPTGTPVLGEVLVFMILDNGTSRTLTWNSAFTTRPMGAALPTATTISKQLLVTCQYNGTTWLCLSATQT